MRRLLPEPDELPAEEIYRDLTFPEPPHDRPYTAINMVSTADGKVAVNGRASGIGGSVDRLAMRLLRSRVDAVMVGAGTVRAEKVNLGLPEDLRGLARDHNPLGVVISESGDIPLDNLVENEGERLLFLISTEASEEIEKSLYSRGEARRIPDSGPGACVSALSLLRGEYGIERLLVEGGPGVNRALIEGGIVDELFVTLSPKLAGGTKPAGPSGILSGTALEEPLGMRLLSAYESGGELYLRYSLGTAEQA